MMFGIQLRLNNFSSSRVSDGTSRSTVSYKSRFKLEACPENKNLEYKRRLQLEYIQYCFLLFVFVLSHPLQASNIYLLVMTVEN